MNYTELEQKIGKQTKSDWHQASGGAGNDYGGGKKND